MKIPTAAELNAHLESDGVVQVTTNLRSTLYSKKHAGWFFERNGELRVRSGKSSVVLATPTLLLVSIRLGRYA